MLTNLETQHKITIVFYTNLSADGKRDIPGLEEGVKARTPAGRWGEPEDTEGTAIFLASRASDFLTGAAIPVDGGFAVKV